MLYLERVNFKKKSQLIPALYFVSSLLIVAFGQPAYSSLFSILASFCGYALFWKALFDIQKIKIRFLVSMIWYMGVESIHLSWMTSYEYQGYYILGVYLAILLVEGVQFGALNLLMKKADQLSLQRIGLIAALWVWMEWLRLFFFCGFPFNPVGMALCASTISLQNASLAGVYGLSFWVMLTNLFCYKAIFCLSKSKWKVAFFCIALLPYLFGFFHLQYHQRKILNSEKQVARALLVQTALTPYEKNAVPGFPHPISPIKQWALIFEYLAEHADKEVDIIVLPEAAVPLAHNAPHYPKATIESLARFYFKDRAALASSMQENNLELIDNSYIGQLLAHIFNAQVVMGIEYVEKDHSDLFSMYASALCFDPHHPLQVYHKRVCLPLVEYIPFEWCKRLAERYGIYGWYERGSDPKVFEGQFLISPSICMEEMYGQIVRENRKIGGEIFVNLTNDVWFPHSKLPRQHFDHGKIRTVECGVPLLRACNTGLTAAVDSLGQLVDAFKYPDPLFEWERGALYVSLPSYHYKTLYSFWGDGFILFVSGVLILAYSCHRVFSRFYFDLKSVTLKS